MWKKNLSGVLLVILIGFGRPHFAAAQDLSGWTLVHSAPAYDYLVSLETEGIKVRTREPEFPVRVFVSRMLTRRIEQVRASIVAERQALGLPLGGYDRYASTTEVIEIRCMEQHVRRGPSTDFDASGRELAELGERTAWSRPTGYADSLAMRAVLEWACDVA